jgi:hypothetical protein
MNILSAVFGKTKKITSTAIAAEIEKARKEHDDAIAKRGAALAGLSLMDDSAHQKAEAEYEAHRRAADRALARVADLEQAHAEAVATEAAEAERQAAERFRQRVEAAREANEEEAAKLLAEYDAMAAKIGDILGRLKEIDSETAAVNEALRSNPVAESVQGFNQIHRKAADIPASEQRAVRKCWVFRYPGSPPDQRGDNGLKFVKEDPREEVREATLDAHGNAIPVGSVRHDYYGREIIIKPTLEDREIVVGRSRFRPGQSELSLEGNIMLPPGFRGGAAHWPRQS